MQVCFVINVPIKGFASLFCYKLLNVSTKLKAFFVVICLQIHLFVYKYKYQMTIFCFVVFLCSWVHFVLNGSANWKDFVVCLQTIKLPFFILFFCVQPQALFSLSIQESSLQTQAFKIVSVNVKKNSLLLSPVAFFCEFVCLYRLRHGILT